MSNVNWETRAEKPDTFDPRYGVVNGRTRFIVVWVGEGMWFAHDKQTGDNVTGFYDVCVNWCWRKVQSEQRDASIT